MALWRRGGVLPDDTRDRTPRGREATMPSGPKYSWKERYAYRRLLAAHFEAERAGELLAPRLTGVVADLEDRRRKRSEPVE